MAQSQSDLETTIVDHIAENAAVDRSMVDIDENILTSGLIDSVGMMRLIADLEDQLDVQVPPQDLVPENFKSIRVMAHYMSSLTA